MHSELLRAAGRPAWEVCIGAGRLMSDCHESIGSSRCRHLELLATLPSLDEPCAVVERATWRSVRRLDEGQMEQLVADYQAGQTRSMSWLRSTASTARA